jgi:Response regulator containing CheY-like receiver, AAA-type ATPase, and DNA-binding domains
LKEIDKKFADFAFIDLKLVKGDNDGIELFDSHLKLKKKDILVIIISGHANI